MWSLDTHSHTHTRIHILGHTCMHAWVPGMAPAHQVACKVVSQWKKLALPTSCNHLSSKLQQLYQLIKCTSLKGTCHEGDSNYINSNISVVVKTHHYRHEGWEEGDERIPLSSLASCSSGWRNKRKHFIFLGLSLLGDKTGGWHGGGMRYASSEADWLYCVLILRLQEI